MRRRASSVLGVALATLSGSLLAADGDPGTPGIPALTFDEAVSRALAHNPAALAAAEEIRHAEAFVLEVRAGWLPSLIAIRAYTRLDDERRNNGTLLAGRDQLSASLALSLPLFVPQRWVQSRQARDQTEVTRRGAAEVRR